MPPPVSQPGTATPNRPTWQTKLPLLLPYLGLCFPNLYTRNAPALWGFPFFYWYQFLWVILTSIILTIYYLRTSRSTP